MYVLAPAEDTHSVRRKGLPVFTLLNCIAPVADAASTAPTILPSSHRAHYELNLSRHH